MRRSRLALMALLLAVSTAACGGGPTAARQPAGPPTPVLLDPARFTTRIDNPYWPMRPGSRWTYRVVDPKGGRRLVEVTVTDQTRTILGVEVRAVRDVLTVDGRPARETLRWYAQDTKGNLWYLGMDTSEYLAGGLAVPGKGSWQAGVDGAQPGILLPARPRPGMARVLRLGMKAKVPFGFFDDLLITREWTSLEPGVLEHKFYAPGVGPVLAITVSGGSGREELLRFDRA